ncbi:MAG: hypothetical protein IJ538_02550 [Clostridia bacterium]|nr:hypothetical protein [Clostridia bacterium]
MGKNWLRLDNAAMIFPPISGKKAPNTFCLSMTLKENINPAILQEAVMQVLESEDTFRVRLKKGLFWFYLEDNDKPFLVEKEPPRFMEYIDRRYNGNYLFRVFYYGKRISAVFFHALTDGTGGLYFLKQVVYTYLLLSGKDVKAEGEVKPLELPTLNEEKVDKFINVAKKTNEKKIAEVKAFKLTGTPFKVFGTGLIFGECRIDDVKKQAKKYGATITSYLCALYIYSIYKAYIENKNTKNKMVAISIPVNIRGIHPSATKRNFSLVVRITYDFSNGGTLEDVIASTIEQFKVKLTPEQIDAQIQTNVSIEKNVLMKFVPRIIKSLALKIAYHIRGVRQESTNLSNLGKIELPESIAKYVDEVRFILQASQTTQKNLGVVGYDNKLFMSFSRRHCETSAEREFFRMLEDAGVDVVVSSNYWEVGK